MEPKSQNEPFKFCEMIQNNQRNDVADKFRAYRLNAESTAVRLKIANSIIDLLKTELNVSRSLETNLRSQVTSAENRLIYLQKNNTKIFTYLERFRQSEGASLEIERKINQIQEELQKVKEGSKNLFKFISNEIKLMKKCEELKLNLKNKENELSLMKTENQILAKQKQEIEIQNEQKFKILENNVEELRRELMDKTTQNDKNLQLYKKQIEKQELTLKEYERERKRLLEEFAMQETSESSSIVAWADSTILLFPDGRSLKNSKPDKTSMDSEHDEKREPLCSRGSLSLNKKSKEVSFKTRKGCKQIPPLEFLTSDSSKTTASDAPPHKRRLFSLNCNHYTN